MKQKKIVLLITILVVPIFLLSQIDTTNSNKVFPVSWDKEDHLSGLEVLAWVHNRDTASNFEYRLCLTVLISKDSINCTEIFFEQWYANDMKIEKWVPSSMHHGSDSIHPYGYFDFHIEHFCHIPTEIEINSLLDQWRFEIYRERCETIEYGYNSKLWFKIFGFIPKKLK